MENDLSWEAVNSQFAKLMKTTNLPPHSPKRILYYFETSRTRQLTVKHAMKTHNLGNDMKKILMFALICICKKYYKQISTFTTVQLFIN